MTLLKTGEPIDAAKTYIVGGWASVNEGTKGPAIYDLVSKYIKNKKSVTVAENTAIKVTGV
jgi:sulfur-oxidizing protein SoxB